MHIARISITLGFFLTKFTAARPIFAVTEAVSLPAAAPFFAVSFACFLNCFCMRFLCKWRLSAFFFSSGFSFPKGYIYPILAAFRALVQVNPESGVHSWSRPPLDVWRKLGKTLVSIVRDEKGRTPSAFAGFRGHWQLLLMIVLTHCMQ